MTAAATTLHRIVEYEVEDLPKIGWIQITHIGEENVYFTLSDGSLGFYKYFG